MKIVNQPDPASLRPRLWSGFHGSRAFDVGSNAGQSLFLMAERFSSITGFEPSHPAYHHANEVAAHLRSIHPLLRIAVMREAVSDLDGSVVLASVIGSVSEETGQLVTPGISGMDWTPPSWDDPSLVRYVTVPCNTLDTISQSIGPPDFVKVDTEGHELHVLRGATHLLATTRPSFLVEYHSPSNRLDCHNLLADQGYLVDTVHSPHHHPGSPEWHQYGWLKATHPLGTGFSRERLPDEDL